MNGQNPISSSGVDMVIRYQTIGEDVTVGPGFFIGNSVEESEDFRIEIPEKLEWEISYTETTTCSNNGAASITVSGGTSPYYYQIDEEGWISFPSNSSTVNLTGFDFGQDYKFTVRDKNNCIGVTGSNERQFVFHEFGSADSIEVYADIDDITHPNDPLSNNGSIGFSIDDGGIPKSYKWSKNKTELENGPYDNSILNRGGLGPGRYTLEVTDHFGCSNSTTVTLFAPLEAMITQTQMITCVGEADGELTISALGGETDDYVYSLYNAVGVLQRKPVKFVGESSVSVSAGAYYAVVESLVSGVVSETITTEVITIINPAAVTFNAVEIKSETCESAQDGEIFLSGIDLNVKEYSINNGAWNLISSLVGNTFKGLVSGTHDIKVRNTDGCESSVLEVEVKELDPLTIVSGSEVLVNTIEGQEIGSITLEIEGGSGNYEYAFIKKNNLNYTDYSSSILLENLGKGTYTLLVRDKVNSICEFTKGFIIKEELQINTFIDTDIICSGELGELSATANGGDASNYEFNWYDENDINVHTGSSYTNVPSGTYYVVLTDGIDSVISSTVEISFIAPITITDTEVDVDCKGNKTGSISIDLVEGGNGSYKYLWYTGNLAIPANIIAGETSNSLSGRDGGTYTVKITDSEDCFITKTYTIEEPVATLAIVTVNTILTDPTNYQVADGSIDITIEGGTSPYDYEWSNGVETFSTTDLSTTISDLLAGEYSLTVTDENGCSISDSFEIIAPISIDISDTSIKCNGDNNGILEAVVNGGKGTNYTYNWFSSDATSSSLGTTNTITVGDGTYFVIVEDGYGNSKQSINYLIEEPDLVTFEASVVNDVPCKGGTNGGIIITATGGSGLYEYAYIKGDFGNSTTVWQPFSDPVTNSTLIAVPAGSYSVQVRDSNECTGYINGSTATIDDTIEVTEPEFILAFTPASGIVVTESEIGGSDGKITINVSGGTLDYTYELYKKGVLEETHTANIGNHTFENLSAGNYTVEVKDANYNNATGYEGCYLTESFIIETNPALEILDVNTLVNNISCYNGSDGSIAITPTGGDESYTYAWEDPAGDDKGTSSSIIGLSLSGMYEVTVTDGRGVRITKEISVTIPSNTTFTATIGNNVYCKDGTDGSIILNNITQDASVADLYYVLYNDLRQEIKSELLVADSFQEYSITGLSAGTYYVKVKNNKGATYCYALNTDGTEKEEAVVIEEPTEALSYSFSTENNTNPNAPGAGNGSIVLEMSGGVPFDGTEDYTVLLAGQEVLATNITITGNTITIGNLSAGSYEFTVQNGGYANAGLTSNSGCSITTEAIVLEDPEELIATISIEENIQCYGDLETIVLKANVTGGWKEYTYEWFEVDTSTTPYQYTSLNATTQIKDLLSAGFYAVRVTDNNGTGISVFADVADLSGPEEVTITTSSTEQLTCYGVDSGEISVTASGGIISDDYTYIWDYESFTGDTSSVTTEEGKRTGLAPGTYTLTVKDDNNCSSTKAEAIFVIDALPVFEVALANKVLPGENLSNGSIEIVSVVGGIAPYTYQWYEKNTAGVFEAMTNRTSIKEEGLAIGDYAIIVTDDIGCTYREEYILKIPGELILAGITEDQPISCYEGSDGILYIETAGGSGGNTYTWYDASDDMLTGTDNPYLENVSEGSYYVVVSDREGLTEQSPVYTIASPDAVTLVTSTSENISCFENTDGIIYLEALGGTENYQYRIRKDSGIYSTWQDFNDTTDAHKTTIENLDEGSYDIQMRDSNTCYYEDVISKDRIVISIPISKPARLEIVDDAVVTDITGFGLANGTITVNVTGGISDVYEYTWNYESSITNETTTVITTTGIRTDLAPGTYTLTVKDANTCEKSATYTITQPDLLEVSISQEAFIQCNGNAQATLKANAIGGSKVYSYIWYTATGEEIGTAQNKNNLVTGDYYVYVVDSNNNEVTSTLFTVTEPEVLTTILTSTSASCGTGDDWTITSFVNGGTAPYSYNWSNGATTASISEVAAGNYFVVIVDANGCRITENHNISVPEVLEVTATVSDLFCASSCIGTIDLDIIGGVAPYTMVWNTGATTESIKELCSGMYTVTITDQKGCEVVQEYTIEEPSGILVDLGEDKTLCVGQSHELDIRINDADATYSWESDTGFRSTDSQVSLNEAGIYTATVTTGLGCIGTDTITVAISEVGIDAEFLITSQAFAEEEIIIINTSSPISNDVEWIFPENVEVVETNTVETLTVRFDAPGAYEITLRSIEGNCFEDYTKTVIVGEAREFLDAGDSEGSSIVDFSMYPNPNSGVFTVVVDLGEEAANASLRLFSLVSNAPMDERELSGANNYESQYNMNLASGIYFLLLETATESEIRKIVIE